MKHMKRLLAAVMALAMVSAIAPMSAFADTQVKQDSTKQSGDMTATYDVTAKYTVTIPAGVTLDADAEVTSDITAENVLLESGKKVTVKLTGGSNTESGSTFNAKKGDSTANYTISAGGSTVSVNDTVATFNTGTAEQTATLTFSKPTGWTVAGEHTETLTFGIAVEGIGVGTVFKLDETVDMENYYYWNDKYPNEGSLFSNAKNAIITFDSVNGTDSYMLKVQSDTMVERYGQTTKTLYVYVGDGHTVSDVPTGLVIVSGSGTQESPFVLGAYYN